jgi:surfactin synthase thioesterase subunit
MKVDSDDLRSQGPALTPYLISQPSEEPRLRLFCFHHAGGGASIFSGWPPVLGRVADVLPVQLPGREKRIREPRITDRAILIDELERNLGPYLRRPYVFYGHSMGGLIAYDFAQQLLVHGNPGPDQVVVGASCAPHLPPLPPGVEDLPDDRLAAWLIQMGGMSAMLLDYPDWLRAAISLVRDDLSLCRSHPRREFPPLPCPIQAFAGADDPLVPAAAVAGWAEHTQVPSDLRQVPGGHLFIRDSPSAFLTQLASVLETVISAPDEAGVGPT